MRNPDPFRDIARVVDILTGAAGALAMGRRTMIVELQRDADDVVAFGLQQRGRHRGIDAAGHGDDDPCVLRTALEIQTVEHGSGHCCDRSGARALSTIRRFGGCKLLFNIGRISGRQSRQAVLQGRLAANLAAGQKRARRGTPDIDPSFD